MKMPTDKSWYGKMAAKEGDHEISAGRRLTSTINPTPEETAEIERLQLEALPAWARDRISQQDAELERMRRELADMTISRDGYAKQAMAREAEGRRKAFIEAAEIAEETAQGSDHLLKAAGQAKDIQGALVHGEGVMTAKFIAAALRAKAEGENHG